MTRHRDHRDEKIEEQVIAGNGKQQKARAQNIARKNIEQALQFSLDIPAK
jgi:hypothetical protein